MHTLSNNIQFIFIILTCCVLLQASIFTAKETNDKFSDFSTSNCSIVVKSLLVAGGTIKYIESGTGGRPVLLLHGLFAQKEQFTELLCELVNYGWYVVAPDLPGFGESIDGFKTEDYQLSRHVTIIHQFTDKIFGRGKQFDISGNSMGGTIAIMSAVQYPFLIRSVAFIGSPYGIVGWSHLVKNAIYSGINPFIPVNRSQFALEMSLLFAHPPIIPVATIDSLINEYSNNNRHYQQIWDILNLDSNIISDQKEKFTFPSLIIWGQKDGVFESNPGANLLEKKFSKSITKIIIPSAAHLVMMEQPTQVAKIYNEFLQNNNKYKIDTLI